MALIEELLTEPASLLTDGIQPLLYIAKKRVEDVPTYYEAMTGPNAGGYQ